METFCVYLEIHVGFWLKMTGAMAGSGYPATGKVSALLRPVG